MNEGDDIFTGEYFVSLKDYKIPLKTSYKDAHFAINNPPPPGTEDVPFNNEAESFVSPLAVARARPPLPPLPPTQQIFQIAQQPPPPPPPPSSHQTTEPIQQVPVAKPTKRSSLFTIPQADGLPEEIKKLFKPFVCELCPAKLNSPMSARLHYESKNHEKKINNWLLEWSERTGEPIPKRQAPTLRGKGPTGPNALHCEICDLALTSIQHAKQHNMGRKHKNALAGKTKPLENKRLRIKEDPTNRFFIGQSFLTPKSTETTLPESVLKTPPPPPPPQPPTETFPDMTNEPKTDRNTYDSVDPFEVTADDLRETTAVPIKSPQEGEIAQLKNVSSVDMSKYCKLCDISVTSEMHMRLHLTGAKHAKKLRQLALPPYSESHTLSQCTVDESNPSKPINASEMTALTTSVVDYSVFRTPSGQYYCQVCDLSVGSEITLSQHFASKRHMKTATVKRK